MASIFRRGKRTQGRGRHTVVTTPDDRRVPLYDTRPKTDLPKLGLCKIRPERFRDMTVAQLEQARFFVGPTTKKEDGSLTNPRVLVKRFISNLLGARRHEELSERSRLAYKKAYGEDPMPAEKIRLGYEAEALRVEKQIYDAQQKKGCKIADQDAPARDYVRSGGTDQDLVNRARGRKKAKIR